MENTSNPRFRKAALLLLGAILVTLCLFWLRIRIRLHSESNAFINRENEFNRAVSLAKQQTTELSKNGNQLLKNRDLNARDLKSEFEFNSEIEQQITQEDLLFREAYLIHVVESAHLIKLRQIAAARMRILDWLMLPCVAGMVMLGLYPRHLHKRRALRLKNNQCVNCGYDLRASSGRCSECGTEIPIPAAAAI